MSDEHIVRASLPSRILSAAIVITGSVVGPLAVIGWTADGRYLEALVALVATPVGVWFNVRRMRSGLTADSAGLVVKNEGYTKSIAWHEVQAVEPHRRTRLLPMRGIAIRGADALPVPVDASMGVGIVRGRSGQISEWISRIESLRP